MKSSLTRDILEFKPGDLIRLVLPGIKEVQTKQGLSFYELSDKHNGIDLIGREFVYLGISGNSINLAEPNRLRDPLSFLDYRNFQDLKKIDLNCEVFEKGWVYSNDRRFFSKGKFKYRLPKEYLSRRNQLISLSENPFGLN